MINLGKQGTYSWSNSLFDRNYFDSTNNSQSALINHWNNATAGINRITNNRLYGCVSCCFFSDTANATFGNFGGLVIAGNSGYVASNHATKAFIHYQNTTSNGTNNIQILDNTFRIDSNAGGRFIYVISNNNKTTTREFGRISGNSVKTSSGTIAPDTRGEIKVQGCPYWIIAQNECWEIYFNTSDYLQIVNNTIGNTGYILNDGAVIGAIIAGNTGGCVLLNNSNSTQFTIMNNVATGGADHDFSTCADCLIIGNLSLGGGGVVTLGSSGRGDNVYIGNYQTSLTIAASSNRNIVSENRITTTYTDSGTDTLTDGRLKVDSAATATAANTTETDLKTYTVKANRLGRNGDKVRIQFSGTTAANANTKQLKLYWAAAAGLDTTALILNGKSFSGFIEIMRSGATAQKVTFYIVSDDGTLLPAVTKFVTGSATLSSDNIVKITGQNGTASAGDISLEQWDVSFMPVA